jgi:hypothetical protein
MEKRKKDQLIFLLNENFIIKIADKKKKSKFNLSTMNGRNGRMGSRLHKEWESRYNQTSSLPLDFLTQSSKLLTH